MIDRNSKKWDIEKYPENWKVLSLACRQRANKHCEICDVLNGTKRMSKAGNLYDVRLAACHINPLDTKNPNPELFAACQVCHARYDSAYKRLLIHLYKKLYAALTEQALTEQEAQIEAAKIIDTVKATIKPLDRATFLALYGYQKAA